jgi:hypothetical protein
MSTGGKAGAAAATGPPAAVADGFIRLPDANQLPLHAGSKRAATRAKQRAASRVDSIVIITSRSLPLPRGDNKFPTFFNPELRPTGGQRRKPFLFNAA